MVAEQASAIAKMKAMVEQLNELQNQRGLIPKREGETPEEHQFRYAKVVVNRDGEAALVELKQLSMDVSLDGEHHAAAAQAYKNEMWSLDHRIGVVGEDIEGLINEANQGGRRDQGNQGGHSGELDDKRFRWLHKFDGD